MRALKTTAFLFVAFLLVVATPAQAWWGWLDDLSGPGKFRGPQFQFRIVCFGEESQVGPLVTLFNRANLLTNKVAESTSKSAALNALDAAEPAWEDFIAALKASQLTFPILDQKRISATAAEFRDASSLLRTALDPPPSPVPGAGGSEPKQSEQIEISRQIDGFSIEKITAMVAQRFSAARSSAQDHIVTVIRGVTSIGWTGVAFSACSNDKMRRSSIELATDFWYADGTTDGKNGFANGEQIRLVTLMPLFTFRVFSDPRFDFVDAGVGAGVYWFTSKGFDSFSGVIVEPARFDFHAPTLWATFPWQGASNRWRRLAAVPTFRVDIKMFPAGFSADAFAGVGDKHARITSELVKSWALFFDVAPFFRKGSLIKTE